MTLTQDRDYITLDSMLQ